jgi:hypothetical protein
MRVGDGRFGILHPPAPQARSVTDSVIVPAKRPGIVTVNGTIGGSSRSGQEHHRIRGAELLSGDTPNRDNGPKLSIGKLILTKDIVWLLLQPAHFDVCSCPVKGWVTSGRARSIPTPPLEVDA